MIRIRLATVDDLPALRALIPHSVRSLSQGYYSRRQIESAIQHVFGPDTQLIEDQTYFAAEAQDELAGCGGWSWRRTLYGGDQVKRGKDPPLDPRTDAARIRAFFVHPDWTRHGIGAQLLQACVEAADRAGFNRLELMATLPGVDFYRRFGFEATEPVSSMLPDGVQIEFVRMTRTLLPMPEPTAEPGLEGPPGV